MTARPWMPLYIADYLADTGHLSTLEHGAYLLLIMHYWQNGGLPKDDLKLSRICRLTPDEWSAARETIADLFDHAWSHKRIDSELTIADETMAKRRAAGKRAATARYSNGMRSASGTHANGMRSAEQSHTPSPSPSPSSEPKGSATPSDPAAPERQLFDRGKEILGRSGGGMVAKLLKAKGGNVALARATLEQASTKQSPREWLSAAIAKSATGPPGEEMFGGQRIRELSEEANAR